ncbi:MAG: UvrD-helicase domain-containing protein [Myxococcales bacterium]|nr:UvrD-helicase domain-containing protein [Myxococcales bacterium]
MNFDLSSLNPQQLRAVVHRDGPLLLLAGAGSGKTRVVTHRIAHLIQHGTRPEGILAVTFTNKAATEMSERLHGLVGSDTAEKVMTSTFHKLGVLILKRDGRSVGVPEDFTIVDTDDQLTLIRDAMRQAEINTERYEPHWIQYRISAAKNAGMFADNLGARITDVIGQVISSVYRAYTDLLRRSNAVDFDDLLLLPLSILQTRPSALDYYRGRFLHILVDEFQDSNHVQLEIIRLLADKSRNVCVVGDDDQSIYGWRGALIRNILEFERYFPDATTITLTQNYRSTSVILTAANAVIQHNQSRRPKDLWTETISDDLIPVVQLRTPQDEARYVVEKIEEISRSEGRALDQFAILVRTNAQTKNFEEALRLSQTPYHLVGGLTFWDRAEIKDALALLRLLVNPNDEVALRRAVGVYGTAVGPATFRRLIDAAHVHRRTLLDMMENASGVSGIGGKAAQICEEFARHIKSHGLLLYPGGPVAAVVRRLIDSVKLNRLLITRAGDEEEGTKRYSNVKELVRSLEAYESRRGREASLGEFLRGLALDQTDSADQTDGKVTLMTLHSAKGLEFPVVFLCGLEERIVPHARVVDEDGDVDEERRLFYVGMTRARAKLILTWCQKRERFGETKRSIPSRFLDELPAHITCREDLGDLAEPEQSNLTSAREDAFRRLASLFGDV